MSFAFLLAVFSRSIQFGSFHANHGFDWGDALGSSLAVLLVGSAVAFLLRAGLGALLRALRTDGKLAGFLSQTVFLICIAVIFPLVLGKWGVDTGWMGTAIAILLSLLAIVIAVGCARPMREFLAGVSIRSAGGIEVGDVVEKNGERGTVLEIGTFWTRLDGEGAGEIVLANSTLLRGRVRRIPARTT